MLKNIIIAAFILTLAGCSHKLNFRTLNGNYTGKFYYSAPSDSAIKIGNATVSFSDKTYSSKGSPDYIPAGGSGTVELLADDIINFQDKNIWTANFDWGLILNGKYKYDFKSDSLILTRYYEPCQSCSTAPNLNQYRLKRSN